MRRCLGGGGGRVSPLAHRARWPPLSYINCPLCPDAPTHPPSHTMVEPAARIRPVTLDDQKHIRFLVGKSTMEPIAVANRKSESRASTPSWKIPTRSLPVYTNPFLLAIWVALSCVWVQLKGWWPNPEHGMLSFLAPIPAFGSLSIAFMFAVDWYGLGIHQCPSCADTFPGSIDGALRIALMRFSAGPTWSTSPLTTRVPLPPVSGYYNMANASSGSLA